MEAPGDGLLGYLIENNNLEKLIPLENFLAKKQNKDIMEAIQTSNTTQKQSGGALGTILASIGIPLAIEAIC